MLGEGPEEETAEKMKLLWVRRSDTTEAVTGKGKTSRGKDAAVRMWPSEFFGG
ncbi:hypothetical protein FTUN_2970 [Frigoriglobus tundricola]|uniref:Uncharacterized protein n=1 Tax=Frigoriglobus tundricola TaxID=2774151 RepID=A0A6M5YQ90_9BACT|nr:hypothetical protein FTUN_2970 [Frigoriglobus tundricola]